jgi:hypothetical protein
MIGLKTLLAWAGGVFFVGIICELGFECLLFNEYELWNDFCSIFNKNNPNNL